METFSKQQLSREYLRQVLIPLPLTGMETFAEILKYPNNGGFNSFTPHGDGNSNNLIVKYIENYVLIPLPLTGMETVSVNHNTDSVYMF